MIKKPLILLVLALYQLAANAQQTYQLDIKKSKILWNNGNTMGGHFGTLQFKSGNLNYSAADMPSDGVFTMDMNTVHALDSKDVADNLATEKAIKKPNFFDISKYPEAVMNVKKIEQQGNSVNYKVTGDLTIKGITNPLVFTAILKKAANTINAIADVKIHRLKYNIDMQEQPKKAWDYLAAIKNEVVADEIAITLKLVFNKM